MELVYLWVEDYKNIQKQGFNFSSRFECEYDEKKNELTIDENDNYIPDFFGENINVTAIVGKNGSGKSSVQELIFLLIYLQYQQLNEDFSITQSLQFNNLLKNIFLIIYIEEEFKVIQIKDVILTFMKKDKILNDFNSILETVSLNNTEKKSIFYYPLSNLTLQEFKFSKIDFYSIYFNYTLDTWDSPIHITTWIDKLYHRNDNYKGIPLLLEPNKLDGEVNIKNISYLNMQRMFNLYSELFNKTDSIKQYFTPNYIYMEFNHEKMKTKINNYYDKKYNSEELEKLKNNWIKYFVKIRDDNNYVSMNRVYLLFKIYESKKEEEIDKTIDSLDAIEYLMKKLIDENLEDYIDNLPILKIKSLSNILSNKIMDCIYFDEVMRNNENKLNEFQDFLEKKEKNDIKRVFNTFNRLVPWIKVSFFENEKNYNSLSTGEKSLLNFSINMLYQIKNILLVNNKQTINLFLDEVELGMHPQWQKRFVSDILNYLKLFEDNKFNIFFSSHSPFLLSDIPKQNIVFLDKYKEEDREIENKEQKIGNCKVLNHDEVLTKKQTFGANIHTLLNDSFFMEDGLMGEFAKQKINEIIAFFDNKNELYKDDQDKLLKIINSIGEPFLKDKFLFMYNEKYPKTDEEKILELEKQIASIKNGQD